MEPAPKVLFTALPVVHVYAVNTAAMAKDSKDNKDALKFYGPVDICGTNFFFQIIYFHDVSLKNCYLFCIESDESGS